ncbi:MAG: ZIP family metal transporter [Planctomycetes bacterium]|nr:ZIP family metal transporter [Planctomycetota bacterium]
MPIVLLTYYCALILVASIIGGMIPVWFQLTHRWMQFAVSFVAGVMLGVAVLHMLPHAITDATTAAALARVGDADMTAASVDAVHATMISLLAGMLAMFFIERFFSYHHHDVPQENQHEHDHSHDSPAASDLKQTHNHAHSQDHEQDAAHDYNLSWSGAALGLMLHSVLNGVALAAAVQHGSDGPWLAGFGTFLVIFLHKPFDAMTIGMLMARGGWSLPWRHTVNALFSLAIPIGVLVFYFGLMREHTDPASGAQQWFVACALAFSAGTFLCISLSDLLPELQFHRHDRVKLSIALVLGLALAHVAAKMEAATAHTHAKAGVASAMPK